MLVLVKKDLKLIASGFIIKKLEKELIKTTLCRKKEIIKVEINEIEQKHTEKRNQKLFS